MAGVDEAGRGPLAGPVVASAVWADAFFLRREAQASLAGLTDSKQLTAAQRDRFFDQLRNAGEFVIGVGQADVAEIDSLNILRATHLAMARAVQALSPAPDFILVDGLPVRGLPYPSQAIVKGDSRSLLIAAASVMAKVTRDRLMLELDRQFPEYGFARHKGYGTAAHLAALRQHGPAACHRQSFAPVRLAAGAPDPALPLFP